LGLVQSKVLAVKSPYPVALCVVGLGLLVALGRYQFAVVAGGLLSTGCFFYNLIWLFSECNSLIGGVPQANNAYITGFLTLSLGYALLCISFFLRSPPIEYVGGLALMCGLLFTVLATKMLFDRILRGASIG